MANIIDFAKTSGRFNGDEVVAEQLLEMFVGQLPEYKDNILAAVAAENCDELYDLAHGLKGSLCYVIIPKLSDTVAALETAAKKKDLKQISALIKALEDQMALVEKEYQVGFSSE